MTMRCAACQAEVSGAGRYCSSCGSSLPASGARRHRDPCLATVVATYTSGLFLLFPVTTDLQAWYAGAGVSALVVFFALAAFGFVNAVGRRPLFGRLGVDD